MTKRRARHAASHDPTVRSAEPRLLQPAAHRGLRGARAMRSPSWFADLDGFKEVNDTYGHDVGDRLIRATAAGFRTLVGDSGVLARLGG